MAPFRHILVPTDFGEAADRALQLAADLAQGPETELIVLHVCEIPFYAYGDLPAAPVDLLSPLSDRAQKRLDALIASWRDRAPRVRGALKLGSAWEEILATASEVGADLIVMGTHGRRGLAHALLGSVAEKVVRLSPAPVLTVRPPHPPAGP